MTTDRFNPIHQASRRDQIPIALAAPPSLVPPRFRALALFGRRPHQHSNSLINTGVRTFPEDSCIMNGEARLPFTFCTALLLMSERKRDDQARGSPREDRREIGRDAFPGFDADIRQLYALLDDSFGIARKIFKRF